MGQGKPSDPVKERERRKKLAAAMKQRYAKLREEQAALEPPPPEPGVRQQTHYPHELRHIEQETGLRHAGWVDAGGKFLDATYNKHTYRTEYTEEHAGPMCSVPIFLSKATLRELEARERGH